jgi:hypothetical protein
MWVSRADHHRRQASRSPQILQDSIAPKSQLGDLVVLTIRDPGVHPEIGCLPVHAAKALLSLQLPPSPPPADRGFSRGWTIHQGP